MNTALIGFFRGLGVAIGIAALLFVGDAEHLAFLGPTAAALIAALALAAEHAIEASTGKALFGAVRSR